MSFIFFPPIFFFEKSTCKKGENTADETAKHFLLPQVLFLLRLYIFFRQNARRNCGKRKAPAPHIVVPVRSLSKILFDRLTEGKEAPKASNATPKCI